MYDATPYRINDRIETYPTKKFQNDSIIQRLTSYASLDDRSLRACWLDKDTHSQIYVYITENSFRLEEGVDECAYEDEEKTNLLEIKSRERAFVFLWSSTKRRRRRRRGLWRDEPVQRLSLNI